MRSEQRREKERSPGQGGGGRESVWFPHYPGRFAATAFCVLVGPVAFIPLIALQHSRPASPPSPPPAARPRPSEGEVTKHEEDQLDTARGTLPTREMTEMRKPATGAAAVHGAGRDVTPSTPTSSAPGSSWKQRPPPARPGGCGRAGQERRRPPGRSPRVGAQCTWVSIAPCFAGNTAGQSEGKTLKGSTPRT